MQTQDDIDITGDLMADTFLFPSLEVGWHEEHGYYAEVAADLAGEVAADVGGMLGFAQCVGTDVIPCAEGNAAVVFGKRNPHCLQVELEADVAAKAVIDVSRWPYGDAYSDTLSALLKIGDATKRKTDYQALGITEAHIPELVQMACDHSLFDCQEDGPKIWGYVHALLALGAFPRVPEGAAGAIIRLLHLIDDSDDDWISGEASKILGKIGAPAIPLLQDYLDNETWTDPKISEDEHGAPVLEDRDEGEIRFARIAAFDALAKIGESHPETRDQCVGELVAQLARYAEQDAETNGFIVSSLIDLKAVEAIAIIEDAFKADYVEESIAGDLEDVRIQLGLQDKRTTPQPRYSYWSPPEHLEPPKPGRNDPCPCGSGKKHKKCCGK